MTTIEMQEHIAFLEAKVEGLEKDKLTVYNLLYRVNKELDEALKNKQTFIASISHELRSPLTAILGYTELLVETPLDKEQKRHLDGLDKSAVYLLSLLSDLLDVSKLKDNKIELNLQEVHLDQLLINCADMVKTQLHEGVELVVDIPFLPYYAYADRKRMQQIFMNLLTNAVKFTKKGKIEFSLFEVNQIDNQLEVILDIKDTGPGIPSKIKDKLFQPFESTDVEQGTGLGLYISQELAQLMGGKITVESTSYKGTFFRVLLYCEKSANKVKRNGSYVSRKVQKVDYSHLNLLLVEDIPLNREYLRTMLHSFFNITADSAENGAIAIEKVRKRDYDLILMDMRMPVMDGLEATRKIRQFNHSVPIICMSANVYREDKHAAKAAGMNDFIEKPLEKSDIESKLLSFAYPSTKVSLKRETLEQRGQDNREIAINHLSEYFDEEDMNNLLEMAKDGLKKSIKSIERHCLNKEARGLFEEFHVIKGILANLGLKDLAKTAGMLQAYAKDEDFEKIREFKEGLLSVTMTFIAS